MVRSSAMEGAGSRPSPSPSRELGCLADPSARPSIHHPLVTCGATLLFSTRCSFFKTLHAETISTDIAERTFPGLWPIASHLCVCDKSTPERFTFIPHVLPWSTNSIQSLKSPSLLLGHVLWDKSASLCYTTRSMMLYPIPSATASFPIQLQL